MKNQTYNGWSNYATWKVNLEIFDGRQLSDYSESIDINDVANDIKIYLMDFFEQTAQDGINKGFDLFLMRDYALSFISDVNWHEIAQRLIDEHIANEPCI